ncbi:hypothetical protein [Vibrio gallaecicus]|nr:hypothetical protein [Vibrio gallaecicus]MDN3614766.1 hypothetical protein [Vibrio gallaecicus]
MSLQIVSARYQPWWPNLSINSENRGKNHNGKSIQGYQRSRIILT